MSLQLVLRGKLPPRHAPQALQPTSKPSRPLMSDCNVPRLREVGDAHRLLDVCTGSDSRSPTKFRCPAAHKGPPGLEVRSPCGRARPEVSEPRFATGATFAQQSGHQKGAPGHAPKTKKLAGLQRTLSRRCFSRSQSRCRSAARLSNCFLPRARPISALTRPRFQYMARGTKA